MTDSADRLSFSQSLTTSDAEAIRHLEQAITGGKQWYIALLETIGLWSSADEARDGCVYHYLIDGEAFDWLLLAGRLCEAVDGLLPADEKDALLFYGKPPLRLDSKQVKKLIGSSKYNQYLNYFYGVTVEQALILTVQEEVYKERGAFSSCNGQDTDDEAYRRIYGATKSALLKRFRRERGYPQLRSISLNQLKEFTYWLFKYRLKECDKARVASDTRKALEQLKRQWSKRGFSGALVADELSAEHY
ncbi:MAG TPA: hypothetical protein VMW00_01040 [Dehalococcoidales bacterium]|nr:hypothetical protein [Dehalococcoidales bacterium]